MDFLKITAFSSIDRKSPQILIGYHICGAPIISRVHALSAAHYFVGDHITPLDITLNAGSNKRYDGGTEYTVSKILLHVLFSERKPKIFDYYISIIKIHGFFEFSCYKIQLLQL
ncbi:Hypothetical predicted protein [Cloeon dipterum]|uniref:Peptidase S1 domain-containing protein n=1 Tax=Cloeon dipterum TaxID=197152 RepID=A0A8S1BPI5_9INSE|nr:Hypothetical predicted protein [Cloeon dipterum]